MKSLYVINQKISLIILNSAFLQYNDQATVQYDLYFAHHSKLNNVVTNPKLSTLFQNGGNRDLVFWLFSEKLMETSLILFIYQNYFKYLSFSKLISVILLI